MASNKIIQNVTKNSKIYLVVCLLIILVVVTYKYNIENYQNIELKLQDFIIPSLDKEDGDRGDKGNRGDKGDIGPQGPHGKLPLNVLKETENTWQAGYGIYELLKHENPKRTDIVNKFVDKIFKDVLELIKKDENQEHKNFILESQNLSNRVTVLTVNRKTLPAISDQKKNIKPYLIVAQYSATLYEQVPSGWQLCDGNNLRYSNTGENSPVKTPDLRGRFIAGGKINDDKFDSLRPNNYDGDPGSGRGTWGSAFVKLTLDQIPGHSHGYRQLHNTGGWACTPSRHDHGTGHAPFAYTNSGTNVNTDPSGRGQPHNNMPPFYILRYIIKQPSK